MPEKLYSIKEVAEKLEVTVRSVRNWINAGQLNAYRFGSHFKISHEDLETFIKNSKVNNENKEK